MLVIQDDHFSNTDSVTVIPITSQDINAPLFRVPVPAGAATGLHNDSFLMVDKIMTVKRSSAATHIGEISHETMLAADRAIATFLGFATPVTSR